MKWTEILNADILKAAAASPMGILALMILVTCLLAVTFFAKRTTPIWAQLSVVLLLIVSTGLAGWSVLGAALAASRGAGTRSLSVIVYFEPATNPNQKDFFVRAWLRDENGIQPANVLRHLLLPGGLEMWLELPNDDTPFYAEFGTPNEIWRTEEYSINNSHMVARRVGAP